MKRGKRARKSKRRSDSRVPQKMVKNKTVSGGVDFSKISLLKLNRIKLYQGNEIAELYYPRFNGERRAFRTSNKQLDRILKLISDTGVTVSTKVEMGINNTEIGIAASSSVAYNQVFGDFYIEEKIDMIGKSGVNKTCRIVVKHNSFDYIDISMHIDIDDNGKYTEVLRIKVPYIVELCLKTRNSVYLSFKNATLMFCDNRIMKDRAMFIESIALWWYQICACMLRIMKHDYDKHAKANKTVRKDKKSTDSNTENSKEKKEELKNRICLVEERVDKKGNIVISLQDKTQEDDSKEELVTEAVKRKEATYTTETWEVRGTLRHYKSGKTVWIKPRVAKRNKNLLCKDSVERVERTYKVKDGNSDERKGD